MDLSTQQVLRYQRQLRLPGFGLNAQKRLGGARITLIGAGGLGCPIGLYLAAAGVGQIDVVDGDGIELSNLHRQVAHSSADVGRNKARSLVARMAEINADIECVAHACHVDESNVETFVTGRHLVVDGTDNFEARYLVSDTCYFRKVAYVYGAIHRYEGQVSVFDSSRGRGCYRCLFPAPPPPEMQMDCSEAGVLGILPGVIGTMMANEAIKYLAGVGRVLMGRVLLYDGLEPGYREIRLERDADCPLCGSNPSIRRVQREVTRTDSKSDGIEIELAAAKAWLDRGVPFLDVRDLSELEICKINGSVHLPMEDLSPHALADLDPDQDWIVYCYDGIRSYRAAKLMRGFGFPKARSLAGGIKAWANEIDRGMLSY